MKAYFSSSDAISDLHSRGFTNDFQLVGNDLLWIQEGVFVRAGEFSILEYHQIMLPKKNMNKEIVFGIVAPYHNIKGILLNHYKSYTEVTPPVLTKKLKELKFHNEQL